MKNTKTKIYSGLIVFGVAGLLAKTHGADSPAGDSGSAAWQKPTWLTDLGLGTKESYDDNLLGVSGNGLTPKSSWITTISPKVGFNFAPLLDDQKKTLQTLSLIYAPDFNFFHDDSSQNYNAHKLGEAIKSKIGDFTFTLDNAFLGNDGNHQAPIYALNQTANQLDKYRSNYAHAPARERLAQIQDRGTVSLQYDWDKVFVRPTATLLYYDLNTDFHNSKFSPWKGYQNYTDRSDLNGGVDFGYKLTTKLAATLGYRYGSQYQQQLPTAIDTDNHYSSSEYQRVLLGFEGKPFDWLSVKLAGGPDFRSYNSLAPINDHNQVTYYGEAVLTATLSPSQTLAFNYKQWQWVSSTGKVPYFDSSYDLNYHRKLAEAWGLDLGSRILEADYNSGDLATCKRDDCQYSLSAGLTCAINSQASINLGYTLDLGRNAQNGIATPQTREYNHQLVSAGMRFKF